MNVVSQKLLKLETVEAIEIKWTRTFSHYTVEIKQEQGLIKEWTFQLTSLAEPVSYFWFDYVSREIQQMKKVPSMLLTMEPVDAASLIGNALEPLQL